jgi:hypothetical protein
MYKNFQRAIIIAGGASVRDGLWERPISEMPLWSIIKNECTFGINYLYNFFEPTVLTFCDYQFHFSHKEDLNKLPFLIGLKHPSFTKCPVATNLITLPGSSDYYGKQSLDVITKKTGYGTKQEIAGIYSPILSGIFTLTLCIALGFKEIYLLGYDFSEIGGYTHFYQDESIINPKKFQSKNEADQIICGIGKDEKGNYRTNIFESSPHVLFDVFMKELNEIKIYNVSLNSKIQTFPKITYNEFYQKLHDCPELILQDRMREYIKEYLELKLK